jgi:hypothetical protein
VFSCPFSIPTPTMTPAPSTPTGRRSSPPCPLPEWVLWWTRGATCPPPGRPSLGGEISPRLRRRGPPPEDCAGCTDADFDAVRALCAHGRWWPSGDRPGLLLEENPRRNSRSRCSAAIDLALELDYRHRHDRRPTGQSADRAGLPGLRGVFHCFSAAGDGGGAFEAGLVPGLRRAHHLQNARRAPEVAAITPLDRMVIETDAPYLTPVPHRGEWNASRYLPFGRKNWRSGRASRWRRS